MGEAEGGICSGKVIGGRYRLLSILGRGGMARVWRGLDQRLDREVAVKVLNTRDGPGAGERFEREARTAAALSHANIVGLHDAGSDDDIDYLVMELVEGETLSHMIRRGPLEAADIAGQICDALAAAHAAGIVHRDIKPGNILVTEAGRVKVCDFGIACHDNATEDAAGDMAIGTAQYMAPEQARGGPATPRTDLYGLGCVIYAMATGHPPFSAKTSARVAWQHLNEDPTPLKARRPGTPSWLDDLVASLLAKEPADRPASAADVRGLLPRPDRQRTKPAASRAHRRESTAILSGETTAQLAAPVGPLFAGRSRLAASGVLTFVGLAAVILVLTAVSANDMPVPRMAGPIVTQTPPTQQAQPSETQSAQPPAPDLAQAQGQPVNNPADALDALRAVLDEQVRTGNLDGKPRRELDERLDEIERDLARGEDRKAADRLTDFAKTLAELRSEGDIEAVTLYALQAAVGDLAEQLPEGGDDD